MMNLKKVQDGSWKKLHNDEPHNLYSSQNIATVIKSRRVRWAGHVARMGGFGWRPEEKNLWEDLGVDGRITLSWTLGR
jgi:hypothetical protein